MGFYYAAAITFFYFIFLTLIMIYWRTKVMSWASTTGKIINITNQNHEGYIKLFGSQEKTPDYLNEIDIEYEYEYEVQGVRYRSKRIFIGDFFMDSARTVLQPYSSADLHLSKDVSVFFDLKNPTMAVLSRKIPYRCIVICSSSAVICLGMMAGFYDFGDSKILGGYASKIFGSAGMGGLLVLFEWIRASGR